MEKHLLRKLRVLKSFDPYQSVPDDPMEGLLELLEKRRTSLAEDLLKIAAERWSDSDSLVAMAMSCKDAATVIYPELPQGLDELAEFDNPGGV